MEKNQLPPAVESHNEVPEVVPMGMKVAAAWAWRLLVIAAALALILWAIVQLRIIVIPVIIAILLAALLRPFQMRLISWRFPKWAAVIIAFLSLLVGLALLIFLIITQFRSGFDELSLRSIEAYGHFNTWLTTLPFNLDHRQAEDFINTLFSSVSDDRGILVSGALSVTTTVSHVVAGLLLALFSTLFFLIDGGQIWRWFVGFMPTRARAAVDGAGRAGWVSVGQYVRVQIFVAFVDAIGIGLGALILQVPLAIPIAVLVFLGSFIPFLGAIATGILAAFVALVYNGPVNALIMLGIVILVNQIEGHVLQPLVMGTAVRVHPLGVVLAVSGGTLLAGIPGALFAVPLVAALNSMVKYLTSNTWKGMPDPLIDKGPPTVSSLPPSQPHKTPQKAEE
ncbi:AI-2E family transporter [Lysinibacter sp. HNR]|uniref:AI-2E family transporter n=1 Tax=Lysinibacter sp. HNR TaxID=3031408 RepID=UPI002434EEDE|nr:AI-2E family transporter [Lysinibacter sp. HNR]WGD36853.1 AI-2E family transporter [Lysinibacter sp. HNR]